VLLIFSALVGIHIYFIKVLLLRNWLEQDVKPVNVWSVRNGSQGRKRTGFSKSTVRHLYQLTDDLQLSLIRDS